MLQEDEGGANSESESVMKTYMAVIMHRLRDELSPKFVEKHIWLREFLAMHGYWIRKECYAWVCQKLKLKRDI